MRVEGIEKVRPIHFYTIASIIVRFRNILGALRCLKGEIWIIKKRG